MGKQLIKKPIIAVTGSAGKTMVKSLISSILREKWVIFESNDYNNTTPKTQEHKEMISSIHRAVVLEYGMAYSGVITQHCSIIQPNIGIITNVGSAHIGNFNGDVKQLAKAKSELIHGLENDGYCFVNKDDEGSKLLETKNYKGSIKTVAINNDADYKAENIRFTKKGMEFSLMLDNQNYLFHIPLLGEHNIYNALFAIAVSHLLDFTYEEIQSGLLNVKKPKHRLDLYNLKDDITLIDDTVHAHPHAMRAALDVLCEIGGKKLIAILGSMPELGEEINQYHTDLGKYVASKDIDFLYTYGNVSIHIGEGAIASGMSINKVSHKTVLYRSVLHKELLKLIEPGTTILVKGASRQRLFNTVEFIIENFKLDKDDKL